MDIDQTENWVKEAIRRAGKAPRVAGLLNLKQQAVSKWVKKLPAGRVLDLSELTNWEITPHQLAPDLYPHPNDGLPEALRNKAA